MSTTPYRREPNNARGPVENYGSYEDEDVEMRNAAVNRTESQESEESGEEGFEMSIAELLYSTTSFYTIMVPVTFTMILSALAVVFIKNEESIEAGAAAMADAYQIWKTDDGSGNASVWSMIGKSLANSLVMVCIIGLMTFVIVLLYKYECMKCLIGYMMFCSVTLLGVLGGNLYNSAIQIYNLPVDKVSYFLLLWNFAAVGVTSVFWGKGIPKYITKFYLIATSVILAWHLNFFDEYSTWALLFMLALYDLCAVLTPCGPLKALVELMSRDGSPEMPGLLFEAELPPEARRPGGPSRSQSNQNRTSGTSAPEAQAQARASAAVSEDDSGVWDDRSSEEVTPRTTIPLAVARVYNLPVLDIPPESRDAFGSDRNVRSTRTPLLDGSATVDLPEIPENPSVAQLHANVIVQLPVNGGRIERIKRGNKTLYLERDRHGTPKRTLWVDRSGSVFAENDDEDEGSNTIRLGLGDFIFYSVLVSKAAQYSFTTFAACVLVILAGLGGTLVLLSVYHHALPALPISIFLGVFFYIVTRLVTEPWIEAVLLRPYYV